MITKIEFCDAKSQVLERTDSQAPAVVHTIYPNDILSYTEPKYQIVGDGLFSYNVTSLSIKFRLSTIIPILDDDLFPIPMDDTKLLNKYMMFITTDIGIASYFILHDDIDWDEQNDQLTVSAVTMIGVLLKYNTSKQYVSQLNSTTQVPVQTVIPRPLKFPVYDPITNTPNPNLPTSPKLDNIVTNYNTILIQMYATSIVNIFSQNNKNGLYSFFWTGLVQNPVNVKREQFANIDTLLPYPNLSLTPINYSYNIFSNPYQFAVLGQDDRFQVWYSTVNPIIGLDNNVYLNNINTSSFVSYIQVDQFHKYKFKQYSAIDFFYDKDHGKTFNQLYTELVADGYFTWSGGNTPTFIDTGSVSGSVTTGQPAIGIYTTRPDWLPEQCKYYYRNPDNDSIPRRLKIVNLYSAQAWINNQPDKRLIVRRYQTNLNTDITAINDNSIDTGFVDHNPGYPLADWQNYVLRWTYPQYVSGASGHINRDDFITGYNEQQNTLKHSYTTKIDTIERNISNYRTENSLTDIVELDVPITMDQLTIANIPQNNVPPQVDSTQCLFQFMIYTNVSILPNPLSNDYNQAGRSMYTRKWQTNTLDAPQLVYNVISDDTVSKYSYLPYYQTKPQSQKYGGIFVNNTIANQITNGFMRSITHQFKLKISLQLIGTTDLDITSNRYFQFKGRKFMCTSIQYDTVNNVTIIEGYGK